MAAESGHDIVWNSYIDKHNSEPTNAQQLLNFSKNKSNNVTALGFSNARKTFNRNKGKGKIGIASSTKSKPNANAIDVTQVTGEDIDTLLNEIEQNEVWCTSPSILRNSEYFDQY